MSHDELEQWCAKQRPFKAAFRVPTAVGVRFYCSRCLLTLPEAELALLAGLPDHPMAFLEAGNARGECSGCGETIANALLVKLLRV